MRQARSRGYKVAVIDLDSLILWLAERGGILGNAEDKAHYGVE